MHGRLKVKTTAQQQEEKRKEREKKLVVFRHAISKAAEKRSNEEYDAEALEIVHKLLSANPDINTMWNFEKEILLHMKKTKSEAEMNDLFNEELAFTESCLRVNPKSYGAWYHRCWVLDTMPKPDWEKELALCDRYFELDERNFHCWDYRRFIVQRARISPEAELKFTMKLINNNFSNYSAWHYRSKLLPLVYPDPKGRLSINEEAHLQELDLVQNAAFTDPNDQSAWFYHRWLLGRNEQPPTLLCLHVNRLLNTIVISASKPFSVDSINRIVITVDNKEINTNWKPSCPNTATAVWVSNFPADTFHVKDPHQISISVLDWTSTLNVQLTENSDETWTFYNTGSDYSQNFRMELSVATTSVLEQELESCKQLQELEPDNKWTLLTTVLLMRAINPEKFQSETSLLLDKLADLDPNRKNYYKDLHSKFTVEDFVKNFELNNNRELNFSNKQLTSLYYVEYFTIINTLDISNNSLTSFTSLHALKNLRKLKADHNSIENCSGIEHLPLLESASLSHNKITTCEALLPLTSCTKLNDVSLIGNSICDQNSSLREWIKERLPILQNLQI